MGKDKWEFINNEILTSSIIAGLSRGHRVYKRVTKETDKEEFKKTLRRKIGEYEEFYKGKVDSGRHIKNIERFANEVSRESGSILVDSRFRIGRAQKVLNLYLKYLWVLGQIPEPPHCPFDFLVIKELGLNSEIKWTESDSERDYRSLVEAANREAKMKNLSIARWELKLWNQRAIVASSNQKV